MFVPLMPSEIEARVTAPDAPGSQTFGPHPGFWLLADYREQLAEDPPVTPRNAVQFSAVFAAVRIIAQTLAACPWRLYRQESRRRVPIVEGDAAWLLGTQFSPECSAFEGKQLLISDALLTGNGYAEIERDGYGRIRWLHPLPASRVRVGRYAGGGLAYVVDQGEGGEPAVLPAADVLHVRNIGPDGIVGWSVVSLARASIQLGRSIDQFGSSFFRRGPLPGGILTMPGNPGEVERKATRESFEKAYSGSAKAGRVVVLSGQMKFEPAVIPNDDAQFLESRRFAVEEIARWFGVPAHKIGENSGSSYNSNEQSAREFVQDTLTPWAARLETEADLKLFGRTNVGRYFTRLDLAELTRGDTITRANTARTLVTAGLFTPNEGRELFDLDPISGGDVLLVQGAMTTLERVIADPPDPSPGPPPTTEPPATDGNGDNTEAPPRAVIEKLMRAVSDKIARAQRRGASAIELDNLLVDHKNHAMAQTGNAEWVARYMRWIQQLGNLGQLHSGRVDEVLRFWRTDDGR